MYELKIARERRSGYGPIRRVQSAADVFEAFRAQLEPVDREQLFAVFVDGRNQVLGFHLVSAGR